MKEKQYILLVQCSLKNIFDSKIIPNVSPYWYVNNMVAGSARSKQPKGRFSGRRCAFLPKQAFWSNLTVCLPGFLQL